MGGGERGGKRETNQPRESLLFVRRREVQGGAGWQRAGHWREGDRERGPARDGGRGKGEK